MSTTVEAATAGERGGQVTVASGRELAGAVAIELRRAARKSRAPVGFVSGGGGFRARRGDRLFWYGMVAGLLALIVSPIVFASIYFGLIASDQYVTEMQFSLRNGDPSVLDSLSGMAGLAASQQNLDSQIIINFIPSRAMIEKLDKALDLRRIYSREDIDWWSRFDPRKPMEDLEKYWRYRVDASIDQQSSIINVAVRAFTAEDSRDLGIKIAEYSEELVNTLTERSRKDALQSAKSELARAEAALGEATRTMRDLRNSEGVIDASTSAKAIEKVIEPLQLQLARLQQQSATTSRSMGPATPQVKILNVQIDSLKGQIARLQAQIADARPGSQGSLADSLGRMSGQETVLKTTQQRYANAAIQYENARVDVETQHAYLLDILAPTLPEKPLYPRRWWGWSIIVFPSWLLWSLLTGLAFLVRDHMAN